MHRVLFICHGNICRSTMAESVFTELVRRAGRAGEFVIDSAATSTEEIGNPPHHGTVAKLREVGIPVVAHRARQVRRAEYGDWDHIVYMDDENARACVASLATTPTARLRACSIGPSAPATWPTPGTPAISMPPTATYSTAAPLCSSSCRQSRSRATPLSHPGLALDRLTSSFIPSRRSRPKHPKGPRSHIAANREPLRCAQRCLSRKQSRALRHIQPYQAHDRAQRARGNRSPI